MSSYKLDVTTSSSSAVCPITYDDLDRFEEDVIEQEQGKAKTAAKESPRKDLSTGPTSTSYLASFSTPSSSQSVSIKPQDAVNELMELMKKASEMDYIGEPISQLEHGLQCAKFARDAGGDDETILGALFHDVGHLVAMSEACLHRISLQEPVSRMGSMGAARHEVLGALYLKSLGFTDKVAAIVQGHVLAKRYLVWKDDRYYQKLSPASKVTLEYQGGPMTDEEAGLFQKDPLFNTILKMRTWDDKAKIVGAKVPGLDFYVPMMLGILQRSTVVQA